MHSKEKGSLIAKGGFKNEKDILLMFKSWRTHFLILEWLNIMGYSVDNIDSLSCYKVKKNYKADLQLLIKKKNSDKIYSENISIKLVSNKVGFNQVDKRWVDSYAVLWNIPDDIIHSLKLYCGEIKHSIVNSKDSRRLFLDELNNSDMNTLLSFFTENKKLIVSDILKGRGEFSADWMLVAFKDSDETNYCLKSIDYAIDIFSEGSTYITQKGNLKLGKIGIQRKGGDSGRRTANMLQFKINPLHLF